MINSRIKALSNIIYGRALPYTFSMVVKWGMKECYPWNSHCTFLSKPYMPFLHVVFPVNLSHINHSGAETKRRERLWLEVMAYLCRSGGGISTACQLTLVRWEELTNASVLSESAECRCLSQSPKSD